jgi:hypothetical protein
MLSFTHQNIPMNVQLHIIGLLLLIAVGGWLSGYDSGLLVGGGVQNFWRRFIRVALTVGLVEVLIYLPGMTRPVVSVVIGVVWVGCGMELVTHLFHRLLDPAFNDRRPLDVRAREHYADEIARLIHSGQREKAFELCERLKVTGEIPRQNLEDIEACLGMDPRKPCPLDEAVRLRKAGHFAAAVTWLNALLHSQPRHAQAVILLMRIYAEDLRQPDQAAAVLQRWEKEPGLAPAQVKFARRRLAKWVAAARQPSTADAAPSAGPAPTVEELVAHGHYGTAVEQLERELTQSPTDFSGWLKLAEIYACHCGNLAHAGKIIRQLNQTSPFNREQRHLVAQRLKEWRRHSQWQSGAIN